MSEERERLTWAAFGEASRSLAQQIDAQLQLLLQYNVDAIVIMTGTLSAEMARRWSA